jgi:broad specificity phosphatase PhoE
MPALPASPDAPRTVVHLLRHGEVFNPGKVLYGRLPGFRLSDAGGDMAHAAARYLRERPLTYIVSSPLERARQTAEPIAELTGLEVHLDERLIEAGNRFEGEAVAGGKGVFAKPRHWPKLINPFRPSWGEPYAQIAERMVAAARAARDAAAATGGEALCVSHQLPIVVLRRHAEGVHLWHDPRRRQCSLASVTSLTFDGDVIVEVGYAEPAGETPKGAVAGA